MPFFPGLTIFDLDGTLIDYEHSYLYSNTLRIAHFFGLDHVTEEIIADSHARDDLFGFIDRPDQKQTIERELYVAMKWDQRPAARLIPGVIETLDFLASRNVLLAIATARHQMPEAIRTELQHTGLLNWIDCITARSCSSISWRDKTRQILLACEHGQVDPDASFMIGDTPSDISSARTAGVGGIIAVRTGLIVEELLLRENPHHVLDSAADVPNILKEFAQK